MPEPSSVVLLCTVLAGLGLSYGRHRNSAAPKK
ncbi:MAG: PEP-CTERM sorting domain-containing protein [Candidatus Solibacter sp.]|nr:PEP-CTERM sorting domain-containing protein [Candidatus Solibacter sp.]